LRPAVSSGGLRGDVYYFAPCGKKIRTYPDVKKVGFAKDVINLSVAEKILNILILAGID
jgi:hypothetical protein